MSAQEITPNASPAQSPSAAVAGNTPMGLQQPAVALSTSSTFNLNLDVKEVQQELSSPQLVAQSGILADKLASLDGGTALARGGVMGQPLGASDPGGGIGSRARTGGLVAPRERDSVGRLPTLLLRAVLACISSSFSKAPPD